MGSHSSCTRNYPKKAAFSHENNHKTLAWCTHESNKISLYDTVSKQKKSFDGVQLKAMDGNSTLNIVSSVSWCVRLVRYLHHIAHLIL